jgi:hypothetical protein
MKKFVFYALVLAVVGLASCKNDPPTDEELLTAITGHTYQGMYNETITRLTTTASHNYTWEVASQIESSGIYTVVNAQMIMTDSSGAGIATANILDKGKTLELLKADGSGIMATLTKQ